MHTTQDRLHADVVERVIQSAFPSSQVQNVCMALHSGDKHSTRTHARTNTHNRQQPHLLADGLSQGRRRMSSVAIPLSLLTVTLPLLERPTPTTATASTAKTRQWWGRQPRRVAVGVWQAGPGVRNGRVGGAAPATRLPVSVTCARAVRSAATSAAVAATSAAHSRPRSRSRSRSR
jgi:hypothetical protein